MELKTTKSEQRFVRKTELAPGEYHKNFYKVDADTISIITSEEADKITPLTSKIYLRLINAPNEYWEREGVLRIESKIREGKSEKAWVVLCDLLKVASATAHKALAWLHNQGVIGYFAGKNGVGIRIFLNRASSSIGVKTGVKSKSIEPSYQKNFDVSHASFDYPRASSGETAFNDSFAVLENLDKDFNSAPKTGAENKTFDKKIPEPDRTNIGGQPTTRNHMGCQSPAYNMTSPISIEEVVLRLRSEIEPFLNTAATRAASKATEREMEKTRTWFEAKALPKAVRVAQSECYNILRKQGKLDERTNRAKTELEVGRYQPPSETFQEKARPLSEKEIKECAEMCIAVLELQGHSIENTLSEISSEAGGWVLPEDAPKVREEAIKLLEQKRGGCKE